MAPPLSDPSREPLVSESFVRSLPLLITAALFFGVGGAVLHFAPRYGPGPITLWGLLLALGFVAAIGGVVSWLFVEESVSPGPPAARSPRDRAPVALRFDDKTPEGAGAAPEEFGRPPPSVYERETPRPSSSIAAVGRTAPAAVPEWDEDAETPALTRLPGSLSAAEALRDLEGIEQELAPRASARPSEPALS